MNLKDIFEFAQDLDIDLTGLFEFEGDDNFDNIVEFDVEGRNVKVSNEYGFIDLDYSDYVILADSIDQAGHSHLEEVTEQAITASFLDQELLLS